MSTETTLTIDDITRAANQKNIVAESILQILDDRINRATATLVNMIDPDIFTLAGHLAGLNRWYCEFAAQIARPHIYWKISGKTCSRLTGD